MPELFYCSKKQLYPKFGYALPSKQVVYVRDDLPGLVQEFVIAHEFYHLRDKAKWWVWGEIREGFTNTFLYFLGEL